MAGGAAILVTGDRDLLDVAEVAPLPILTPRELWELLRTSAGSSRIHRLDGPTTLADTPSGGGAAGALDKMGQDGNIPALDLRVSTRPIRRQVR